MKNELKPCPFCSCKEIKISYPKPKTISIKCTSCMVEYVQKYLRMSEGWLLNKMVEHWNTRAKLDAEGSV